MTEEQIKPDCLFCKLARDPGAVIWENDQFVALNDIHPKARLHFLIIPKQHVDSLNQATPDLAAGLIAATQELARVKEVSDGYKVIVNVGRKGGQEINHLHLHLLVGPVKGFS